MSDVDLFSDDEASPEPAHVAGSHHHAQQMNVGARTNVQSQSQTQVPMQMQNQNQNQNQNQIQAQTPAQDDAGSNNFASNNSTPANINSTRRNNPLLNRTAVGQASTILPAEKVFPIQVGTELFRLSGASISSDGPSYFTHFFEEQVRQNEESGGVRTLYIDRDPVTFRDIARHLQGYYVKPTDGGHFVRLFADAQFYSLPRLITQLFDSEIFIQIGEEHFQIPKDLFSDPGNSPNFFSLGFAVFFSTPNDVFPGLDKRGLLRPPPINPPHVPSRSSEIFNQILHLLRGYPLDIKNEIHREQLLRDCRYFHLRGLEQRIIAHAISYNLERKRTEICLRLDDLKPSGISYQAESREVPMQGLQSNIGGGWVYYSRPFVDEHPYELIVEIGKESTEVDLDEMRAGFHGIAKARFTSLIQVVANKMNLPANAPLGLIMLSAGGSPSPASSPGFSALSDDMVKVQFDASTALSLDGQPYDPGQLSESSLAFNAPLVEPSGTNEAPDGVAGATKTHPHASAHANPGKRPISSNPKNSRSAHASDTLAANTNKHTKSNANPNPNLSVGLGLNVSIPPPQKKRKLDENQSNLGKWIVRTGQWRLRVQPTQDPARSGYEIILVGVKIDAFSCERYRNARRGFLTEKA